jgi:hypothetical protein
LTSLDHFTLDRFAWSTPPPLAPEHIVDLDRFARSTPSPLALEHIVDLDHFAWSTPPPLAPGHAIDLYHFARSTPPPLAPKHAIYLNCFTDSPDCVLRSTPYFPSPRVIHEELVNYCRILSSSSKIELPGHSGS